LTNTIVVILILMVMVMVMGDQQAQLCKQRRSSCHFSICTGSIVGMPSIEQLGNRRRSTVHIECSIIISLWHELLQQYRIESWRSILSPSYHSNTECCELLWMFFSVR